VSSLVELRENARSGVLRDDSQKLRPRPVNEFPIFEDVGKDRLVLNVAPILRTMPEDLDEPRRKSIASGAHANRSAPCERQTRRQRPQLTPSKNQESCGDAGRPHAVLPSLRSA
jgi:hypothetical protein